MNLFAFLGASAMVLAGLGTAMSASAGGPAGNAPVTTVGSVDLERYAGLWYEIAKIPNRFQKKCTGDTTAVYRLRDDGRLDVENRCKDRSGSFKTARGVAKVVDTDSNAKLKVSFVKLFGKRLFWGDYWIIGLGDDYEYAIVGHPKRKYGWILSRTPALDDAMKERIQAELRAQGYDPDDFETTVHSGGAGKQAEP